MPMLARLRHFGTVAFLLALPVPLAAHDEPPAAGFDATAQDAERQRFADVVGWDLENAPVRQQTVGDGLHVLFGAGGNVLVSIGPDGVLMVDDQFPQTTPKLLETIERLGGEGVDFVVNTHWHFDHADGNLTFGPGGAWLVSHAESREMMQSTRLIDLVGFEYTQQAYPPDALPVITYDRSMQFHFNGERIDLMHFGPAHTTGDTAVIFRGHNVVHLGDVFNAAGYPFIDVGNGGDLDGVIAFCRAVLDEIDTATVVVPGHGAVSSYQDLEAYVSMLETVRSRIAELVGEGADLETVLAAKPTRGFDDRYGDPERFIDRAYFSLAGGGSPSAE
ncbi:MAG TPA: MBL fold metallo-hydrolase [Pseudomonadales bacterium]